ncbi:MAG: pilus assembly protein [Acidobacteria bacterium]|nr:pilus assembly protein [Acidobacteriota bacterium]
MRNGTNHRRSAESRGSTIVEFGLMLVVLLPLMFGVIDLSRVFHDSIAVWNAAQAGAEYGVYDLMHARNAQAISAAASADASDVAQVVVSSSLSCKCSTVAAACTALCSGGAPPAVQVNVVASKTFTSLFRYPGLPPSINLRASAVMRVQ